jgi:putative transcriptional regulator
MALCRRFNVAKKKTTSRIGEAILEMAADQRRTGIMGDVAYHKITIRHLSPKAPGTAQPISGEEIRTVREQAHLSQAALARYLNLTVGYVSQLERGTKQAKGPALALLNVIRRKGLEVIL